jgi:transketolase
VRRTCLNSIYELAKADERVVFIGSDITKRDLSSFAEEYPDRFFMEGIYEQHLIGMAAGLAFAGKVPYINTIATFLTRRCYEQILVDLCIHDLPVRLVGSGGGTVYAPLGSTHMANEDIAMLRVIPNMTVIAPCDAEEMKRLMPQTLDWPHPIYIRLAKGGDEVVSREDIPFEIGKAISLREGRDILYITTGITTARALLAAELLNKRGIDAGVLHVHTVKPLDSEGILQAVSPAKLVMSIEEHRLTGGLGSAVAELLAESGSLAERRFARIGLPDVFTHELGSQDQVLEKYGLGVESIVARTVEMLDE